MSLTWNTWRTVKTQSLVLLSVGAILWEGSQHQIPLCRFCLVLENNQTYFFKHASQLTVILYVLNQHCCHLTFFVFDLPNCKNSKSCTFVCWCNFWERSKHQTPIYRFCLVLENNQTYSYKPELQTYNCLISFINISVVVKLKVYFFCLYVVAILEFILQSKKSWFKNY